MKKIRYWREFAESLECMGNLDIIKLCQNMGLEHLTPKNGPTKSREVFALNDHYVIKVARNPAGREQNYHEITIFAALLSHQKKYFAHLDLEYSKGEFVIMERVNTFKESPKGSRTYWDGKFRDFHLNMAKNAFSLYAFDLLRAANVGKKGNRFVALDYGFSYIVSGYYGKVRIGNKLKRAAEQKKHFALQEI